MSISNTDDIIDSRDVFERIEELEAELVDYENPEGDLEAHDKMLKAKEELSQLKVLTCGAKDYAADWLFGESLIRDSYFTRYIEDLINDCYELPKEFNSGEWPWRHMKIDFKGAAEEAKQDYTAVDFDGVTYWIR